MTYPRVCIIDGNRMYSRMFEDNGWTVVDRLQDADLVQFTGGEDVTPALYGHKAHPLSSFSARRDEIEQEIYQNALDYGIPMAGICRGGQFLNVMNGGTMLQHVDGHATGRQHLMVDVLTGEMISVTSTHHQMMQPAKSAEVIAVASESTWYDCMKEGEPVRKQAKRGEDIEVLYYHETECLCYQPHPEFLDKTSDCQKYYFDLIQEVIGL